MQCGGGVDLVAQDEIGSRVASLGLAELAVERDDRLNVPGRSERIDFDIPDLTVQVTWPLRDLLQQPVEVFGRSTVGPLLVHRSHLGGRNSAAAVASANEWCSWATVHRPSAVRRPMVSRS